MRTVLSCREARHHCLQGRAESGPGRAAAPPVCVDIEEREKSGAKNLEACSFRGRYRLGLFHAKGVGLDCASSYATSVARWIEVGVDELDFPSMERDVSDSFCWCTWS